MNANIKISIVGAFFLASLSLWFKWRGDKGGDFGVQERALSNTIAWVIALEVASILPLPQHKSVDAWQALKRTGLSTQDFVLDVHGGCHVLCSAFLLEYSSAFEILSQGQHKDFHGLKKFTPPSSSHLASQQVIK